MMMAIKILSLMVWSIAVNGVPSLSENKHMGLRTGSDADKNLHVSKGVQAEEEACPPCELLFRQLETAGKNGKLTQDVRVQERGEPKSGTGMMFDWGTGALVRTCDYLQDLFGEGSCRVDFTDENNDEITPVSSSNRTMTFEPARGGEDARCSCETVKRVSIGVGNVHKHTLPVDKNCAYRHPRGIDLGTDQEGIHPDGNACTFQDGTPVKDLDDLWQCMVEADCDIVDDWLQMVVLRDPRPVAVSAYFHIEVHGSDDDSIELGTLEDFVEKELPLMCQWVAIRYILFSGLLPHQSVEFWYDDALDNPLEWHYRWYDAIGLQLPFHVVQAAADAAAAEDFGFQFKQIDKHPGGQVGAEEGVRRFEDEVSKETLEVADAIMRKWLPPVLLAKLGIAGET